MLRVLYLATNPTPHALELGEEYRAIVEAAGAILTVVGEQASVQTLGDLLDRHQPDILHIGAHGEREGLVFEDGRGGRTTLDAAGFTGLLRLRTGHLQALVLNACWSEDLAAAAAEVVPVVVGTRRALPDALAIAFARSLYRNLAERWHTTRKPCFAESFEKAIADVEATPDGRGAAAWKLTDRALLPPERLFLGRPDDPSSSRHYRLLQGVAAPADADELAEVLALLPAADLRIVVARLPRGAELIAALADTPDATLPRRAADLLRRRGRVDAILFHCLREACPAHAPSLLALQQSLGPEALSAASISADPARAALVQELASATRVLEEAVERGDPTVSTLRDRVRDLRGRLRSGPTLNAGEALDDGRYTLVEPVGQGGFGTVWRAWDRKDRRDVAIKVLHGQYADDRSRVDRFFDGARQMARLDHPAIARVLRERLEQDGFHYFVMEWAADGDLHAAVLAGRESPSEALDAVVQVARALHVAHERGLVHRDVKPHNILLRADGSCALTDFDLVHAVDATHGTRSRQGMGSLGYAAPELLVDAKAHSDRRADVYGLGMTALFCLRGADPSPHEAYGDLEGLIRRTDATREVRTVLIAATQREPSRRTATAEAFADALRQATAAPPSAPASGGAGLALVGLGLAVGVLGLVGAIAVLWALGVFDPSEPKEEPGVEVPTEDPLPAEAEGRGNDAMALSLPGGVSVEFVSLAGGNLTLGTSSRGTEPRPLEQAYEVSLPPFAIMRTEVTRRQFQAIMGVDADPSTFTSSLELPVENVYWKQAYDFCQALDARAGGDPIRLPTEAEWEYAARAGSAGDQPVELAGYAVYDRGWDHGPLPVREGRRDNGWGLYDMAGNVWEWTLSVHRDDLRETHGHTRADLSPENRTPEGQPIARIFRGGGYSNEARRLRPAERGSNWADMYRRQDLGFRCVSAPPPP